MDAGPAGNMLTFLEKVSLAEHIGVLPASVFDAFYDCCVSGDFLS